MGGFLVVRLGNLKGVPQKGTRMGNPSKPVSQLVSHKGSAPENSAGVPVGGCCLAATVRRRKESAPNESRAGDESGQSGR